MDHITPNASETLVKSRPLPRLVELWFAANGERGLARGRGWGEDLRFFSQLCQAEKKSAKSDRLAGSSLVDSCSMDDKVCCEG